MGSVPNVGLMAQKAEEYGSHDKTFEISSAGRVRIIDTQNVLTEHVVLVIFGVCASKRRTDPRLGELAVRRARATGSPAVFWLDDQRPHDAQLIKKVKASTRA